MNSAGVNIKELDISLRVVESKMSDDLVRRCLGAAVADGSRLVHLRRNRGDVDDALRTAGRSRRQRKELMNKMEEPDDVDSVHVGKILDRGVLGRFEADIATVRGTGDEHIDVSDGLDDFAHAREVGLRGSVSFDLGIGVGFFKCLFSSGED